MSKILQWYNSSSSIVKSFSIQYCTVPVPRFEDSHLPSRRLCFECVSRRFATMADGKTMFVTARSSNPENRPDLLLLVVSVDKFSRLLHGLIDRSSLVLLSG